MARLGRLVRDRRGELTRADGVGDPLASERIDEARRIAREQEPSCGHTAPDPPARDRPPSRPKPFGRKPARLDPKTAHSAVGVAERRAEPPDPDRLMLSVRKDPSVAEPGDPEMDVDEAAEGREGIRIAP